MVRGSISAAVALVTLSVTHPADLDSVSLPEMRLVSGIQVRLNGNGLRTFSVLGARIYIVGLYLVRRGDNPDTIQHSPETKLSTPAFFGMWMRRMPKSMAGVLRAKLKAAVQS